MRVQDLRLVSEADTVELSALIDCDRLRFRFPSSEPIERRVEPFVVMGLLDAMAKAEPLEVEPGLAVSPRLLRGLDEIQAIYHSWNPELTRIEVIAEEGAPPPARPGAGSMFSGGIDSSYTLLRRRDEITHLVFIAGFGDAGGDQDLAAGLARNREYARVMGKPLVTVESHGAAWARRRKLTWGDGLHGSFLAAVGLALGFSRVLIPASHTYAELFPWGSHPLTDPLWGTERTAFVHHGAGARRTEKLKAICASPNTLDNLNVCWRRTAENCGRCAKCLRDMTALHLLRRTSRALPGLRPRGVRRLRPKDESGLSYLRDLVLLAGEVGDRGMSRRLRRVARRYEWSEVLYGFDRLLFAGRMRSFFRLFRGKRPPALVPLERRR